MQDQINSTRLVTDGSGNKIYSAAFDPYGGLQKVWTDTYSPALQFSGKERDKDTDADYFGARHYAHGQYRWLSPDPLMNRDEAIADPQAWNLYAYVGNNPVSLLDPDGREKVKPYITLAFPEAHLPTFTQTRNFFEYLDYTDSLTMSYRVRIPDVFLGDRATFANFPYGLGTRTAFRSSSGTPSIPRAATRSSACSSSKGRSRRWTR